MLYELKQAGLVTSGNITKVYLGRRLVGYVEFIQDGEWDVYLNESYQDNDDPRWKCTVKTKDDAIKEIDYHVKEIVETYCNIMN